MARGSYYRVANAEADAARKRLALLRFVATRSTPAISSAMACRWFDPSGYSAQATPAALGAQVRRGWLESAEQSEQCRGERRMYWKLYRLTAEGVAELARHGYDADGRKLDSAASNTNAEAA